MRYSELINEGTSHEKFIQFYISRLKKIESVAKASGIEEEHINGRIPKEVLKSIERDIKWSIDSFYEFSFPS